MDFFGFTFKRTDKNKNNVASSIFDKTVDSELESIVDNYAATSLRDHDQNHSDPINPEVLSNSIKDVTCVPINSNKITRLRQYNVMSRFPEIQWCIDEHAMDFFHKDENSHIINLTIKDKRCLDDAKQKIIQDEFENFMRLFNLDESGYTIVKNYIIEGEVCWENIIDPHCPEKGIRAIKYIPTKYYDFLKDKTSGAILGIYFDKDQVTMDLLNGILSNTYAGASNIFNAINTVPSYAFTTGMTENKIPLFWPQITYFNSGMYNYENSIVYPLIENAAAPYQQLSLLQDAAVILRITRAPERLVFNISTGGLPEKKAKTMVNAFVNAFKSKKVSNSQGEVRNSYNPAAMLDSYFFWKQDGSEGSSVNAVNSQANYDQMNDIDYFLRRILKAFKVPYTRFKEDGMAVQRKEAITYEEYSFTKFILRQQIAFANAIKKSFIVNLKLRKIWEDFHLNENLLTIEFVKPSLYELYQAQQLASLKMQNYKDAVEDESFSKGLAMQKYLGYTDEMVNKNNEEKRKELLFAAATEFLVEKMKKDGPANNIAPIEIKEPANPEASDTSSEFDNSFTPPEEGGDTGSSEEESSFVPPETSEEAPVEQNPSEEAPIEAPSETPKENINASIEVSEPSLITPPPSYEQEEEKSPTPKREIHYEFPIVKSKSELPTFREIFSKR